jgi:hypothetical protein
MMADYDYSEVKQPRRKRSAGLVWNVLTILVVILIFSVVTGFILIYLNPSSSLNPFPLHTASPTATALITTLATHSILAPSWTPASETVQMTNTPESPQILPASSTPVNTSTPVPTAMVIKASDYAFTIREGNPAAIDAAQFHPDAGCKWLGVAGQATSMNGESVKGLFVHLGGSLPGIDKVDNITMTGLAPQYGQGGFEITIFDQLIASSGTLWLQLTDQDNLPLSDRVYFDTYDDCTKNLVIIYFDQVR